MQIVKYIDYNCVYCKCIFTNTIQRRYVRIGFARPWLRTNNHQVENSILIKLMKIRGNY